MSRIYHYHGFDIEVAVETDFSWKAGPKGTTSVGFVAVVRISKAGASLNGCHGAMTGHSVAPDDCLLVAARCPMHFGSTRP